MRSKTETKLIAGFEVSTLRVYDNSKPYYNHKQVCVKVSLYVYDKVLDKWGQAGIF